MKAAARLRLLKPRTRYCSFCGKADDEVFALVSGPEVMICDECIAVAQAIITEKKIAAGACAVVQRIVKSS